MGCTTALTVQQHEIDRFTGGGDNDMYMIYKMCLKCIRKKKFSLKYVCLFAGKVHVSNHFWAYKIYAPDPNYDVLKTLCYSYINQWFIT